MPPFLDVVGAAQLLALPTVNLLLRQLQQALLNFRRCAQQLNGPLLVAHQALHFTLLLRLARHQPGGGHQLRRRWRHEHGNGFLVALYDHRTMGQLADKGAKILLGLGGGEGAHGFILDKIGILDKINGTKVQANHGGLPLARVASPLQVVTCLLFFDLLRRPAFDRPPLQNPGTPLVAQ